MTKRRDRYVSGFDINATGVAAASYDLKLALMLLERYLEKQGLLQERVEVRGHSNKSLSQVLEIANGARRISIDSALDVYALLRRNAAAADVLRQKLPGDNWREIYEALAVTLDKKAIFSHGYQSKVRLELARLAKETADSEA